MPSAWANWAALGSSGSTVQPGVDILLTLYRPPGNRWGCAPGAGKRGAVRTVCGLRLKGPRAERPSPILACGGPERGRQRLFVRPEAFFQAANVADLANVVRQRDQVGQQRAQDTRADHNEGERAGVDRHLQEID